MQTNKHLFLFLFLVVSATVSISAQENPIIPLPIKAIKDSIHAPLLPITLVNDSISGDSIKKDTVIKKKQLLLGKIKYKAKDYVKLSQKDQKIYLYNEAEIYYQDTELKAGIIVLDLSLIHI